MLKKLPTQSKKNFWNQSGFTLIELLVVVMVISALSGVVVSLINSGGFRDKAKDAQRVADLKQIQTALELYFADNRSYPIAGGWIEVTGSDTMSSALHPTYINKVPVSNETTTGRATPCDNQDQQRYNYITNAQGTAYILTSVMALPASATDQMCNTLENWGSVGSCSGAIANCYGVQNP